MTYIDRLNSFNRWLESNALPANAHVMYYGLLHIFNRAGWPETVQVDNLRLMLMIGTSAETTAVRARDKLVDAGLIRYKRGKKGVPGRYSLCEISFQYESLSAGISAATSDNLSGAFSAVSSASHINTKRKTKKKNIPPNPQGKSYDIDELEGLWHLRLPKEL